MQLTSDLDPEGPPTHWKVSELSVCVSTYVPSVQFFYVSFVCQGGRERWFPLMKSFFYTVPFSVGLQGHENTLKRNDNKLKW